MSSFELEEELNRRNQILTIRNEDEMLPLTHITNPLSDHSQLGGNVHLPTSPSIVGMKNVMAAEKIER